MLIGELLQVADLLLELGQLGPLTGRLWQTHWLRTSRTLSLPNTERSSAISASLGSTWNARARRRTGFSGAERRSRGGAAVATPPISRLTSGSAGSASAGDDGGVHRTNTAASPRMRPENRADRIYNVFRVVRQFDLHRHLSALPKRTQGCRRIQEDRRRFFVAVTAGDLPRINSGASCVRTS